MSIEQNLERIANALEVIASMVTAGVVPQKKTGAVKPTVPTMPVTPEDQLPGVEAGPLPPGVEEVPGPGGPEAPAPVAVGPKTPDELAKFGQAIIAAAGQERTKPFVDHVRGKLLPKYGAEVTNLCKVPADKVGEVVAALIDYAKKNGIKVQGVC